MKARHLEILEEQGFPVPKFILVSENEEVNLSFSKKEYFAVRSNFSSEDSGEHSFAGQFLTRLNVKREKVKEAVEEVFASYAGSLEYKEKANRGKTEYDLKQQDKAEQNENTERQENAERQEDTEQKKAVSSGETVLIQEMLFPEKSGVLFTKNPKGILSEMVVVLGQGLGDKVVEDQENVLTYHYFPGECLYREGYGVRQTVEEEISKEAVSQKEKLQGFGLEEDELKTLFSLGEEIEQLFQKPMDIEFAIEKGKIYILQAREITTLDMHLPARILDNSNISESFPGICLPLSESFAGEMYSGIFTSLGRRFLGKSVSSYETVFQRMVGGFSGRMYYEISSWYDILRLLPFSGKIIPVWQGMLGISNEEISFSKKNPSFFLKCRIALLFCYYFLVSQRKMKELDKFFQECYASYSKRVEEEEEAQELYRIFLEMKEDLLREWDITLMNDMVSFISTHLYGKKTAFSLETMKPVRALSALKAVARKHGLDSEEYRREKKKYISAYGDRIEGELKLETRTYRSNEELLDRWILDSLETEETEESRLIETEKAESLELPEAGHSIQKAYGEKDSFEKDSIETDFAEKDCEETSLMEKPSEQKQRKSFLYRLAESSCNNREISRLHRTRCFGLMRRIVDKIGEKTIGFDVYYLSLNELKEFLFSGKDFSLKIAREKELRKAYEKLPVLSRVKLLGKVDRDPLAGEIRVLSYESFKEKGNIEGQIEKLGKDGMLGNTGHIRQMEKAEKKDKEAGNVKTRVFFGRGVSKGIFRGEVLKIKSLQEVRAMEAKGKILLSYSTDPGWFPYLNLAEGLITERGSLLSHSAILARELEKPAVVNIPHIMEELQSGDIVEIDGDLGICSVIKQKEK